MAKVVTDDKHYRDMADTLRMVLGNENTFKSAEMQNAMMSALSKEFSKGELNGRAEAERECRAKHFAQIVKGDGSTALTLQLPFDPDVLYIFTNDPDARTTVSNVAYVEIDFSALGQLAGKKGCTLGGINSYANMICAPSTAYGMYARAEDGTATINNVSLKLNNTDYGVCKFKEGVNYVVLIAKLGLLPLKTRIEESVARLPDTKVTAYYQSAKVNEALTSDEWAALMATKPNCTFSMC